MEPRRGPHLVYALPLAGLLFCLVLGLGGCARSGARLGHGKVTSGGPDVQEILDDLAADAADIESFKATGRFSIKVPGVEAVQSLSFSTVVFRRPADLYIVGRKLTGAAVVFRLSLHGPALLFELPIEKKFYYRARGDRSYDLSSVEIAKEMFLPDLGGGLARRQLRLLAYDEESATLAIGGGPFGRRARKRITVAPTESGWVVRRIELLDGQGGVRAVCEKEDYAIWDDVPFPRETRIATNDAQGEQRSIRFSAKRFSKNLDGPELDRLFFDLEQRVGHLKEEGYRPLESLEDPEAWR